MRRERRRDVIAGKQARRWWTVFGAGSLALGGVLLWLSIAALEAERVERATRAKEEELAAVRLALWRLDAWLGGFLAREAARSYRDYQDPLSPLTQFHSDYIQLHFQIDSAGRLSSPSTSGDFQRLAGFDPTTLGPRLAAAETLLIERLDKAGWPGFAPELSRRAAAGAQCQLPSHESAPGPLQGGAGVIQAVDFSPRVGSLVPLWLPASDAVDQGLDFVFIRRVETMTGDVFQGFLGRWQPLREALLTEIDDLLPGARLVALPQGPSSLEPRDELALLATLPAILQVASPAPLPQAGWTPTRSKLATIWLAAGIALAAVGLTLRASIDFGRRRQRFAAAMTHELRTPLTTFRMYTEMLADGTIKDPRQRQEYLETLQDEASRLSGLVENVLTHAGLEEEPADRQGERLSATALLEHIAVPLHRLAQAAGLELEVDSAGIADAMVEADVELVARMLFNLVDNACKYAASRGGTIHLEALTTGGELVLRVRDHGPGIPVADVSRVFEPFARGSQESGDLPGSGLGLALTRDSARSLGGDLTLEQPADGGACFRLCLPILA
ncbi:MAG: HAMP domain-containing sensor histidine kinase [Acidobacteriota bacterium]